MTSLNGINLSNSNLDRVAENISSSSAESKQHAKVKLEKAREYSRDGYIVSLEHTIYIPNNKHKEYVVDVYAVNGDEEVAIEVGNLSDVKAEWLLLALDEVINVNPDNMDITTHSGQGLADIETYFEVSGLKEQASILEGHIRSEQPDVVDITDFEEEQEMKYILDALTDDHELFTRLNEEEYKVTATVLDSLTAGKANQQDNELLRKVREL